MCTQNPTRVSQRCCWLSVWCSSPPLQEHSPQIHYRMGLQKADAEISECLHFLPHAKPWNKESFTLLTPSHHLQTFEFQIEFKKGNASQLWLCIRLIWGWFKTKILVIWGAPGWLSRLSIRLQLRSWSHGSWFPARVGLCADKLGAWSLLWILCVCVSLWPSPTHAFSFSVSEKWINLKKKYR